MTPSSSVGMLFARLEVSFPAARSFLIASARSSLDPRGLAAELASIIERAGLASRLIDITDSTGSKPVLSESPVPESDAQQSLPIARPASRPIDEPRVDHLRELVRDYEGYTVIAGRGVLDHPGTLLAAGAVDGVVLVVRPRKTYRSDLQAARTEVERAGGRVVGAVLTAGR